MAMSSDAEATLTDGRRARRYVAKNVWKEATRPVKQTKEKEVKDNEGA
jgi:hypothetical protein